MSASPEDLPTAYHLFDITFLDQNDPKAARQALADETLRIIELGDNIVQLAEIDSLMWIKTDSLTRAIHALEMAKCVENRVLALATHEQFITMTPTRITLLETFFELPPKSSMDDILSAAQARDNYMSILRLANQPGWTIGRATAIQRGNAILSNLDIETLLDGL